MLTTIKNYLLILLLLFLVACSSQSPRTSLPSSSQQQKGIASFYADKYQSQKTASGEYFDQNKRTAAHKTLRFGTWVRVTNINNGRSVVVRVNDRGPFTKGRIIDLSKSAFSAIANTRLGVVKVKLNILR